DRALARLEEALALAHDIAHPLTLVFAIFYGSVLHQFRRQAELAERHADFVIAQSLERGFSYWSAWGSVLRGWAVAQQGQEAEGISQIRHGLAGVRAGGSEMAVSWLLALLAEAYGKAGEVEEALNVLVEALAVVRNNDEHLHEAEIYR